MDDYQKRINPRSGTQHELAGFRYDGTQGSTNPPKLNAFDTLLEPSPQRNAAPIPLTLPTDSAERKNYPMLSGCLNYFPAALAGVSKVSKVGNDKHNPGQPLHHARAKSTDHGDCIVRHLTDTEDLLAAMSRTGNVTQEQVLLEVNQLAWRVLAYSQMIHERFGSPMAPGAK